jgi:CheY-like chemotaxis protein
LPGAVLVVDDEDIVMNVAKRFLEHVYIRVMTACNGAEAVDI